MGRRIENYICTSIEDCRTSMPFISDLGFLRELLARCQELDMKGRAAVVARRIGQIEKEAKR